MKNLTKIATVIIASTALLVGCGNSNSSSSSSSSTSSKAVSGKITIVGSTALQPLVEKAAENFQADNSKVNITVQGGGSGTGLSQVQSGAVTIGNSDIFAEKQSGIKAENLVDHQVAVVGMTPVVNKDAGVKNLKMSQLREIFTGKITNWNQVGGKNEKIVLINRPSGSGTRATFEGAVMNGETAAKSQEQDSNGTVQKMIAQTPGSISYLAFSYVKSDVQALSIDGVAPTDDNVTTNKWKIWSYEHMYTKGKPDTTTKAFLNYMTSSKVQKSLVKDLGYISISNMKVQKDANGKVTDK
ncbi:phosphate ABC transporter substrate-binding protein [Liquorilactobacillus satsumensis]|uniref:Phosphate-binding protein n=1 Tax=Liquorilactobacillus satsumensis DSM 16230 = JCM 12392 TaxID=1423801 RepID=A0A0R1V2S9_9LACO|nr:phosphate ABC transporter substrate-binding protein [Liquorilactobacillus satsumensis]KRL98090.1 ABC-type phosphate transport system, periplasmic component [Liquorilactobacillus satsumensis DSM 16230 = JCM 12392]MCC7667344.1 phosphate ABC transporter substrate-binding protein [Liquorilactobacillus satsumensis]MCP9313775.1 phosphate ABC transporter substrate-binding protein [Liquorilactobacillus satsumensis]MCP9329455.1 phosphate ABC transporter substrate-binding protein [Liquorilactobacillus